MQHRQVVEIEIAVVGDLPVRPGQDAAGEEVPVLEAEMAEQLVIARQEGVDVEPEFGLTITQISPARSATGSG